MNIKTGFFVVGELKGVKDKQWSTGTGSDHLLGVSITRPDSWGGESDNVFQVKIYSGEVARVDKFIQDNIGKLVSVQFAMISRQSASGKRWQEYAITSGCLLTVL